MSRARRRLLSVLGTVGLMLVAGGWSAATAAAFVFHVTVTRTAVGRPVPDGFLGMALEYRAIPALAGSDPPAVDPVLVQLIHNLVPRGRPVLRIGGQSTDRTWWPVAGLKQPLGVTYDLTPGWLSSAQALAQATDARLILGVPMEPNRQRIAAVEARHLLAGIQARYIAALEIGNEPELYTVVPWYRTLNGTPVPWYSHVGTPVFSRAPTYDPQAFAEEFSRTLAVVPRVPIAGPVTGNPAWLHVFRRFLSPSSRVRMVTWHAYGLNQCITDPANPQFPSVPNLLKLATSRDFLNAIPPFVALTHRDRATFRVDEMNSVTCNGHAGVSNTLGSALWLMDALFATAAHGVDGVNIHTFPDAANGLFDFDRANGQWEATVHAPYYGMLMFARAAPPGSRLLALASDSQAQVRAWATVGPDHRIRVLLINDNLTSSAVALVRTPVTPGPASVERLRASSAYATTGLSLGGQSFGGHTATGLLAAPVPQALPARAGAYAVTMPAGSAALLTLGAAGP
jgi:hypothetical protein